MLFILKTIFTYHYIIFFTFRLEKGLRKIKITYDKKEISTAFSLYFSSGIALLISCFSSFLSVRVFGDEALAYFGVYSSVINILMQFITLKFDFKISYCDDLNEAFELLLLSSISAFLVSIACVLLFTFKGILGWAVWFIPLGAFFAGINAPLYSFCVCLKKYWLCFVAYPLREVAIFISIFIFSKANYGLILSQVLGYIVSDVFLFLFVLNHIKAIKPTRNDLVLRAKENLIYPKSVVAGSLFFSLGINLPGIFIPKLFGTAIGGCYGVVLRLLSAPIAVMSQVSSQLILKSCSGLKKEKEIRKKAHRSALFLWVVSIFAFGGIFLFRRILALVFFPRYLEIGNRILIYLLPLFLIRLVVGAVIVILPILEKAKDLRRWQEAFFAFNLALLGSIFIFRLSFWNYLCCLSVFSSGLYLIIYYFAFCKNLGGENGQDS